MFKRVLAGLLVLCSTIVYISSAYAGEFAVVDLDKVIVSYGKAQELIADMKIKEADLEKFVFNARKDLKAAKSESDRKLLEQKYAKQLEEKKTVFKQEQGKLWDDMENEVIVAVKKVSDSKSITTVFRKDSIILGGEDLTDDVIKVLNTSPEK